MTVRRSIGSTLRMEIKIATGRLLKSQKTQACEEMLFQM